MEGVVYPRTIGLDIHQKMIVCCFTAVQEDRTILKETAEFETFKRGLKALASWCRERTPDVVIMESTGIYWKAPYACLERAGIVPAVVNARHIKNLEGKKTDMADAEWLAVVARGGMFCRSYVPKEAYRNMRGLSRHVLGVTRNRQQYKNRISKILTDAGARLNVVFSDISGVNARRCVKGLIAGMKPEDIAAALDYSHLKASREDIAAARECELTPAHLAALEALAEIVDFLTKQIDKGRKTLLDMLPESDREMLMILQTIPGIQETAALELIVELGGDNLEPFAYADRLASWVGLCSGNKESGGKRRPAHTRKGNMYLRRILCEIAHAAVKTKGSTFQSKYKSLRIRKGAGKTIIAIACKIIKLVYTLVKKREGYRDPHIDYEKMKLQKNPKRHIQNLFKLEDWQIRAVNTKTGEVLESTH